MKKALKGFQLVGSVGSFKDVQSWFLPCLSDFFCWMTCWVGQRLKSSQWQFFCRFAPTTIKKMIVLSSYISPFRPQRGNILAGWERLKARTSLAFIFDDGFVSLHQIPFVLSNIETNTKFVFFSSLKICLGLSQRGKKFSLTRAKF